MSKYRDNTKKRLQYCLGKTVIVKGTIMNKIYDDNTGKLFRIQLGRIYVYDLKNRFICKVQHSNILAVNLGIKENMKDLDKRFETDLPISFKAKVEIYQKNRKEGMQFQEIYDYGFTKINNIADMNEYPEDLFNKYNLGKNLSPLAEPSRKLKSEFGVSLSEIAATKLFTRNKEN